VDEVDIGGDVAGPLAAAAVAEIEGLVQCGGDAGVPKPGGDVADGGSVVVVEVMTGGDDLYRLGAGFMQGVEQAGVQTLLEKDVGGQGGLHSPLKVQQWGTSLVANSRGRFGIPVEAGSGWGRFG